MDRTSVAQATLLCQLSFNFCNPKIYCRTAFVILESPASFIIHFSPSTTSEAEVLWTTILQWTLIKQVNKMSWVSWGKMLEKKCNVMCYNPKCRTVDAFQAISCTDFNDDISTLSPLIVLIFILNLLHGFFGVIPIFEKSKLECDIRLTFRDVSKYGYVFESLHPCCPCKQSVKSEQPA